jgi:hypothetical protein
VWPALEFGITRCYIKTVDSPGWKLQRVFKTAWFSKASAKAHITDAERCSALRQVMLGQCDDLGGGVFKKRLGRNQYRSIIVAKGGRFWVYEYLFAKKDRANIEDQELTKFRRLAKAYETLSGQQLAGLIENKAWMEICNEDKD